MKKFFTLILAALVVTGFTACSSDKSGSATSGEDSKQAPADNNTKKLKPTINLFEKGNLSQYVELEGSDATLTKSIETEKDRNNIDTTYIFTIKVKVKLVKECTALQGMTPQDIAKSLGGYENRMLTVDKAGETLFSLGIDKNSTLLLAKLLTGKVGEVVELTYVDDYSAEQYNKHHTTDYANSVNIKPYNVGVESYGDAAKKLSAATTNSADESAADTSSEETDGTATTEGANS